MGHPVLVYVVPGANPPTSTVYFARRKGVKRTIEEVERKATIAADGGGKIGLAFSSVAEEPSTLYHARRAGLSWAVKTVITGTQAGGNLRTNWFVGALAFNYYSKFGPPCVIPCPRTAKTAVVRIEADGSTGPTIFGYSSPANNLRGLAVHGGAPQILFQTSEYLWQVGETAPKKALWYSRIAVTGTETTEQTQLGSEDFASAAVVVGSTGEPLVVYYAPAARQLVVLERREVAAVQTAYLPLVTVDE
jgi:hypothetical protein